MKTLQDVIDKANQFGKFSSDKNIHVLEHSDSSDNDGTYQFRIYTNDNSYSIVARTYDRTKPGNRSYLGCIASSRKPRAGEDWTRGNDLADGDISEETWNQILADIVSYELVVVHQTGYIKERLPA